MYYKFRECHACPADPTVGRGYPTALSAFDLSRVTDADAPSQAAAGGGTVSFFDSVTLLGAATVAADGTAAWRTAALAAGLHHLSADFAGGEDFLTPYYSA